MPCSARSVFSSLSLARNVADPRHSRCAENAEQCEEQRGHEETDVAEERDGQQESRCHQRKANQDAERSGLQIGLKRLP